MLHLETPDFIRPLIGLVIGTVYQVTNQRPDEVWSFQTQRSQSELQKLISSTWFNLFVVTP